LFENHNEDNNEEEKKEEEEQVDFDKIIQDLQKPDGIRRGFKEGNKEWGEKARVTIPIDWDDIIEKHIKNTNTNVIEQKSSNESESDY